MDNVQNLLKDLKDIHQPATVSAWPPAIGWWLLLILVILLIVLLVWFVKRKRMPNYKKLALLELKNVETNYQIQKNAQQSAGEIALLIRKAMVAKYGNQPVAGLVENEWLERLDNISKTDLFSNGPGRVIITAHYVKACDLDAPALFDATKKLLSHL